MGSGLIRVGVGNMEERWLSMYSLLTVALLESETVCEGGTEVSVVTVGDLEGTMDFDERSGEPERFDALFTPVSSHTVRR
jgi:hypothetical protein